MGHRRGGNKGRSADTGQRSEPTRRKFSRLYAEADPEDQFALRVWMRDIILSRKERSVNMFHARRSEKRMIDACERRILEFPVGMDAREVAKELKREGWYAWATEIPKYHSSN